jgi:isopentenyldiphosphate isomerase
MDEKIAIVETAGNIIKYVYRSQTKDSYTWRIICIWIENDKGQVLLQQRSKSKKLGPGLWTCAVEGTVEGNDSYADTARREIYEEIGLTDFELEKAGKILYKSDFGSRLAQGYKVKCNWPLSKFVAQPEEVEQLKWVDRKVVIDQLKLGHPDFPDSSKAWLEMFNLA